MHKKRITRVYKTCTVVITNWLTTTKYPLSNDNAFFPLDIYFSVPIKPTNTNSKATKIYWTT